MKLSFKHKVFLTLLLNSLAILVCMLLIAAYYAARNFEEYVNKVEMKKISELADLLSEQYRQHQSWGPLLDDMGRWLEMVGSRPGTPPGRDRAASPPPPPALLLPEPRLLRKPLNDANRVHEEKILPERAPIQPSFERPPPIALFDAAKAPLGDSMVGSIEDYRLTPIRMGDQLVGWLGTREHKHPAHPLDIEFLNLQAQTFYAIGGVALLLAVFVTWVLSRHLLAPVKELAEGTRALTSRRFETRIEVRSGDELGLLAADFNNMAQALERYEQLRRQWIADISHELRTPLAILRGEIEAMLDGVREFRREALESLHFEVLHVSRIVHDLHDLSIIESEAFNATMTPISPFDILDETLDAFLTRLEQRGIRVEVDKADAEAVRVPGDEDRMKQLCSNLLENTLRYANGPGVLWISHKTTPESVVLLFEDSGPGVPEESLERLFDRLYRVDKARSRAQGGSGLGLAICRSIVESFGGRIEASNGTAGGLRICIRLPRISIKQRHQGNNGPNHIALRDPFRPREAEREIHSHHVGTNPESLEQS